MQPEAIEKQDIKKQAIVPDNGTLTSLAGARMNTDLDEAGLARQFFQPHTTSPSHMQSEQPQEKKQNKGQSTRRIVVSNNRHFKTKTDLFNNTYRPNDSLDGSYVSNDIYGEYVMVGNEDPYHASNESDQNEKS